MGKADIKIDMKVEDWMGHKIRFVFHARKWWAVAKDICEALDIENCRDAIAEMVERYKVAGIEDEALAMKKTLTVRIVTKGLAYIKPEATSDVDPSYTTSDESGTSIHERKLSHSRFTEKMVCITEPAIYEIILSSIKPEAVKFRKWLCTEVMPSLREASGFEVWKVGAFMQSAEHYRVDCGRIQTEQQVRKGEKAPYCKVAAITMKCMANLLGLSKAISKPEVKEQYPQHIAVYDEIHQAVTDLANAQVRFNLDFHVGDKIYADFSKKYPEGL